MYVSFHHKNYLNKVNGNDLSDYCQKEFKYGFDRLQRRVIPIIVDSDVWKDIGKEKKTLNARRGRIGLNLSGFLYHGMSRISDSSTPPSSVSNNIDELFERISSVIGFSQEPTAKQA